jgi:hypothetical protein
MTQKPDDLEALKTICNALEPFDETDRERILRWTTERLGMKTPAPITQQILPTQNTTPTITPTTHSGSKDVKTFLTEKAPNSVNQSRYPYIRF